jgi:hypothetical protein
VSTKNLIGQWMSYVSMSHDALIDLDRHKVGTDRDQVVSVPRRFLDPRRPFHKPTKDDAEEMLLPYEPLIPPDARWVVSADERIAGVSKVVTTSTLLESTSRVLAFGIDIFAGAVTPSKAFDILSDDFNKVQLIITLVGLIVALSIVRPIVCIALSFFLRRISDAHL